jgi:hypothetical protein
MSTRNIRPLDELADFELETDHADPTHYAVIGAADFVFGRVRRLLVDLDRQEVVYLVVNTRISNYQEGRGEERLVPLAWGELVRTRRQIRLPHLSRFGFMRLPLYQPDDIPEHVAFPTPNPEDPDLRDIA